MHEGRVFSVVCVIQHWWRNGYPGFAKELGLFGCTYMNRPSRPIGAAMDIYDSCCTLSNTVHDLVFSDTVIARVFAMEHSLRHIQRLVSISKSKAIWYLHSSRPSTKNPCINHSYR
jgi:hypothetical protein